MSVVLQVRNVPDALHRKLKARAAAAGKTLSDFVLEELRRVAETPTREEILERLRSRAPVRLPTPASRLVREERDAR